ncbi:MAG: hypothetical protein ACREIT_12220, partial [Tepidisphaeraceae bacterium]
SAWLNRHDAEVANGYPCEAADFVDARVAPDNGWLINEFNWGGYLAWRLGEKYQVLMDGRTQLYDAGFWRRIYGVDSEGQLQFLSDVTADAAILPARRSALRNALLTLGWATIYRDERAVVMVPPAPRAVTPVASGGD